MGLWQLVLQSLWEEIMKTWLKVLLILLGAIALFIYVNLLAYWCGNGTPYNRCL
jgi:hypothetical protein